MRNIYEVIRQKEAELQQLLKELEALRLSARLLADEKDPKVDITKIEVETPPVRAGVPIAAIATDTEVLLSSPRRQFP